MGDKRVKAEERWKRRSASASRGCLAGERRVWFAGVILVLLALAGLPAASPAAVVEHVGHFTGWPDGSWQPVCLYDPDDPDQITSEPGGNEHLDFVGDSTDPGLYMYNSGTYLFFRVRVNFGGPVLVTPPNVTYADTVMIMIDTNKDGIEDYAFAWDSKGNINYHGLEQLVRDMTGSAWNTTQFNDIDGQNGVKGANDINGNNRTTDGYVRTVDSVPTAHFGTTTFIDIAVSCSYLATYVSGLSCSDTDWQIQVGSIHNETDHKEISFDVAKNSNPNTKQWLDPDACATLVDLASFSATALPQSILLRWETAAEIDNAGFNVWRAEKSFLKYQKINDFLIPAEGNGVQGREYAFTDDAVLPDKAYRYKLEDIDLSGKSSFHGPVSALVGAAIITEFPQPGAILTRDNPATFQWESQGIDRFWIEFSPDARFTERLRLTTSVSSKGKESPFVGSYAPTEPQWKKLLSRFGQEKQEIYWRILGKNVDSQTYYRSNTDRFLLSP